MIKIARRIVLSAATLLLLLALPGQAADVRSVHRTFVYYDVSGTTLQAINDDMVAKSPPEAGGYVSVTMFQFVSPVIAYWNEPDASGTMTCRPTPISVSVDIAIVLPRHPTISEAPADVQAVWYRFIKATEAHELHHAADFAETGFALLDQLEAIRAPDCDAVLAEAQALHRAAFDKAMQLGVDYDVETNHGIDDGAILR